MHRKIAHFRLPGMGNRMWSYPRYIIPGVSPSVSVYDHPTVMVPSHMTRWTPNGTFVPQPARLNEDTVERASAVFTSLPAQHIFQGGWVTRWTGSPWAGTIARLSDARQLNVNANPNAPGSKEQQRATVYDPWPSAGAIFPKAV